MFLKNLLLAWMMMTGLVFCCVLVIATFIGLPMSVFYALQDYGYQPSSMAIYLIPVACILIYSVLHVLKITDKKG